MRIFDGLTNALSKLGTRADPRRATTFTYCPLHAQQIEEAYLSSGMLRKCIDIPAIDAVRNWREWKADDIDVEAIEKEEKRLGLRDAVYRAEILRGLGGGAIILGATGNPDQPIPAGGKGLAYLLVVSRWQINLGDRENDPASDNFGKPKWFEINNDGANIRLDPSRVVCFTADPLPSLRSTVNWQDAFWGVARAERLMNAVKNADTAQDAFATLIHKARVLRVGMPDLSDILATADGEAAIAARLSNFVATESLLDATIYDAGNGQDGSGEKIEQFQVSWAGMPEIMTAYDLRLCAVADIPATRLLGKAAEGMNSSGDGQQQDWHKHVRAHQDLRTRPCVEHIDRYMLPNQADKSLWFEWAALDVPDEMQEATRFKTMVETAAKAQETGAIPEAAFNEGFQSMLVNEGFMPALETALEKIPESQRYSFEPELPEPDANDPDPNALTQGQNANDAAPRSLYVQRKLLNAGDVIKWARAQGFESTLEADDMHVTVLYSRAAVDWMKMGQSWSGEAGKLTVQPGGARIVELLGDEGAVVLLFNSSELAWRHEDMVRNGASHDYPEYQPHVTITYSGAPADLSAVEPYRGELIFGPEIFEELDLDWAEKVKEAQ